MKIKMSFLVLTLLIAAGASLAFADEDEGPAPELNASITAAPLKYAFVKGDKARYREQRWSREGYTGGVENFTITEANRLEGVSAEIDGRFIPVNNDYEANVLVKKEDLGYTLLEYQEFSKFYDDTGAFYHPFTTLESVNLGKDLELEIGRIKFETGLTLEDLPEVVFMYERRYRKGSKSRLTYGVAREGTVSRGIVPSFQDIDETVDIVELRQSYEIKGFELTGKQHWEWMDAKLSREERNVSTTAVAADKKIRVQDQEPESRLFSTTQTAQRWFLNEKVFSGLAYNYVSVKNSEVENIFEMNENRIVQSFANPKQIRNAYANNHYDSHTWATSFLASPWSWLTAVTKFRSEVMDRSGDSIYPSDTNATPNGIVNTTEVSASDSRVRRFGEGLSLRTYAPLGISIYNDFELEQIRNWLSEDRTSIAGESPASAGEIFTRETITYSNRGSWTLGARWQPHRIVDMTGHFRYYRHNNDYDDIRETPAGTTAARSAFFDELDIKTQELAYRITLKPHPKIRPSFRYTLQMRDYLPRAENQATVETDMNSHIFSFDVTLTPLDNVIFVTGLTAQNMSIRTPARQMSPSVPTYDANVLSWINHISYALTQEINLVGGTVFSKADNFTDFTASGLPLGVSYTQFDFTLGVEWRLNEALSVISDYGYYHYGAKEMTDQGDYNASVLGLKTVLNWG